MTRYTHPDLPDFISPAAFTLEGIIMGVDVSDQIGSPVDGMVFQVVGDGTGAMVEPKYDEDGSLTGVEIIRGGWGYTTAYVEVKSVDPDGGSWEADAEIGSIQYPRVWWRTVERQGIEALGFVEYVAPEPEPLTLEQRKAIMLDAIRAMRWQCETGGITVNGAAIRTDEVSQAKITGAVSLFASDETLTSIDWEAQPSVWISIDSATMMAIGIAVGRHVQACFSHARSLSDAVEVAEDDAALDAIDIDAGWPA